MVVSSRLFAYIKVFFSADICEPLQQHDGGKAQFSEKSNIPKNSKICPQIFVHLSKDLGGEDPEYALLCRSVFIEMKNSLKSKIPPTFPKICLQIFVHLPSAQPKMEEKEGPE